MRFFFTSNFFFHILFMIINVFSGYVLMWFFFLTMIIDAFSRYVLMWFFFITMTIVDVFRKSINFQRDLFQLMYFINIHFLILKKISKYLGKTLQLKLNKVIYFSVVCRLAYVILDNIKSMLICFSSFLFCSDWRCVIRYIATR